MNHIDRRRFVQSVSSLAAGCAAASVFAPMGRPSSFAKAAEPAPGSNMSFGLVTYLWGRDWDLPTLIANCEKSGVGGVELRTTHAHGVEPALNEKEREDVRRRFADSAVEMVGMGSDERFDNPDPAVVKKAIEATQAFIRLSHDVGGTGVKVKPDRFHPNVPREKTIEQIGRSLGELGEYALGFGQEIRLEVHGQCAEPPTIRAIIDIAKHENVKVCWNSNPQDLQGAGLQKNLELLLGDFGATVHIHELDSDSYPWADLFKLLAKADYAGWLLLEASSQPEDRVAALTNQAKLFAKLLAAAQANL